MHNPTKTIYRGQFKVRWTDKDGVERSKSYSTYKESQKALQWLRDMGYSDADIAIDRSKISSTSPKKEHSDE